MSGSVPKKTSWRRIEQIYHAALEQPSETRLEFVARECQGDQELRAQVETLLETEGIPALVDRPALELAPELLESDAPLQPGTTLGPYRIEAVVGTGGMGSVYRAHDTRLQRTVALKISRREFTERFEREARAVAALNHSHIGYLYDVGPNYLVLEYIEGQPLKGPLQLRRAQEYAMQILDALDAAHRKGIVHRDLKPSNILVTKQGIKLLDFGLAKQAAVTTGQDTVPGGLTAPGTIIGTLQYMSPEQLQGKAADARSDLFSFGCVLYEMLTGKRAFDGENPASVIAAVLQREPEPLQISPPLDRIVRRCLAKDPDERFQTAADLKAALGWALEEQPGAERKRHRGTWAIAAAACAGGLAIALLAPWWRATADAPVYSFRVDPTEGNGYFGYFALSPDGRRLAVNTTDMKGQRSLMIRSLDSLDWQTVMSGNSVVQEGGSWSRDGKQMAFTSDAKLKKLDLASGTVQVLADYPPSGPPFTGWSATGGIVFSRRGGLWSVPSSGGAPKQLTVIDPKREETWHHICQFLPDGRHFLYLAGSRQLANSGIFVGSVDGKPENNRRYVMSSLYSVVYAPGPNGSSYLLFERERALMGQQFDLSQFRLTGEPFMVLPAIEVGGTRLTVSVSRNGVIAYSADKGSTIYAQLAWFNRAGERIGEIGPPGRYQTYGLSPDGRRVVVQRIDRGDSGIWIIDPVKGNSLMRLTLEGSAVTPVWSKDGNYVAYVNRAAGSTVYRKRADGSGAEEVIAGPNSVVTDWSRDGRLLGFTSGQLWINVNGREFKFPRKPDVTERFPRFSPDGNWIAYVSDESRRQSDVYVRNVEQPDVKYQISSGGGLQPMWRGDGKELFYVGEEGMLMAVPVKCGAKFEYGTAGPLFRPPIPQSPAASGYAVSPDGQRFLFRTVPAGAEPGAITIVSNWSAAVKR